MSTVAYKCINCGGPLEFNPAKQMFSCEYCRSDFTEKELKDHFGELDEKLNDENNKVDETQTEDDEFGFALAQTAVQRLSQTKPQQLLSAYIAIVQSFFRADLQAI